MFLFHIAFALSLMSIATGFFLHGYSAKIESGLGKLFGTLIVIFALLSTICTSYYQFMLWKGGIYQNMMAMHENMMMKEKPAKATETPASTKHRKAT